MKKVKWTLDCIEGDHKPTVVEHEGYKIVQCTNNHIQIYKDDRIIMHASCTKKMTEEELKKYIDFLKDIQEGNYKKLTKEEIQKLREDKHEG